MVDNKVSLEGELRILKFGQGKLFGPDRKVVHFTGESASTYIANKNRVAEIINETLQAEQASVTKVAAPSKILSFSKDFRKTKENIKIYDKAPFNNTFVLLNGALQTNITAGKRAMSTFEYVYLREGKQIGLAKPSKFLPKTAKLPKRPNPKYNEQLQEYYKSWEQCAEYKERYNSIVTGKPICFPSLK